MIAIFLEKCILFTTENQVSFNTMICEKLQRNRTNQSFQEALFLVYHSNSSFKTLIMSETMLLTGINDG